MASHKNRLHKLEQASNGGVKQCICVYYEHEQDKGFDVKPVGKSLFDEPIHLDTRAELEAMQARADVSLQVIAIRYAGDEPQSVITWPNGTQQTVGIDL